VAGAGAEEADGGAGEVGVGRMPRDKTFRATDHRECRDLPRMRFVQLSESLVAPRELSMIRKTRCI
jgi:hypothetical protein